MSVILIVEDEKDIRELLCMMLPQDHMVIQACNGIEGLEMFEIYQPDLVITDYQMPKMTGIDLINMIKAREPELKTKIIVISACFNESPKMTEIFLAAGASLCLKKPQDFVHIEQYISLLLTREVSS